MLNEKEYYKIMLKQKSYYLNYLNNTGLLYIKHHVDPIIDNGVICIYDDLFYISLGNKKYYSAEIYFILYNNLYRFSLKITIY